MMGTCWVHVGSLLGFQTRFPSPYEDRFNRISADSNGAYRIPKKFRKKRTFYLFGDLGAIRMVMFYKIALITFRLAYTRTLKTLMSMISRFPDVSFLPKSIYYSLETPGYFKSFKKAKLFVKMICTYFKILEFEHVENVVKNGCR